MNPNTPFRSLSQRLGEPSTMHRTPSRRQQFTDHEINPLLSNLSPSSTLEALLTTNAVPQGQTRRRSVIQDSVASASTSERAWGIKAALAGKKIREWEEEILGWSWPGFAAKESEEGHRGGLPARSVLQYEERLDVIKDDMETLEVEDLKAHALNAHCSSRARQAPIASFVAEYQHLDDFTAIVIATIVQSLPILSRLRALLNVWTTRILVLHQVPGFLRHMTDSKESMVSAWLAVGKEDDHPEKPRPGFSHPAFMDIQAVLSDQIAHLGRELDNMLDLLEGSQDILPDLWIDDFEKLEVEYSAWVVKAEELVLKNELDPGNNANRSANAIADAPAPSRPDANIQLLDSDGSTEPETPSRIYVKDQVDGTSISELQNHTSTSSPARDSLERDRKTTSPPSNYSTGHDGEANRSLHNVDNHPPKSHITNPQEFSRPARKPPPLVFDPPVSTITSAASSDISSESSEPNSTISDYFSDRSSPELRSASIVEYVSTPALVTSPWASKEALMSSGGNRSLSDFWSEKDHNSSQLDGFATPQNGRSRASTYVPEQTVNLDAGHAVGIYSKSPFDIQHTRARSASWQSLEVIPKSEIRKIEVRRSGSYTSGASDPQAFNSTARHNEDATSPNIAPHLDDSRESSEPVSGNSHESKMEKQVPSMSTGPIHSGVSRSQNPELADRVPPVPPKPHRFEQVSDLGPGLTPVKIRRTLPTSSRADESAIDLKTPPRNLPINMEDRLEARISSILTEIPTHIRLTAGPEPDGPDVKPFYNTPHSFTSRPSALRMTRAQTSIAPPTLTLAPAHPKPQKSKQQNGESEIKLYHLHQTGKDVPIKLFVRLVGETGERVMVRIGGGWADLAEYLKEYASHHGKRSVSDTRFDILGIPSSPASQTPPSANRPVSPTLSRPSPTIAFKRQQTTPGKFETPHTPVSDPTVRSNSRMSWTDEDSPSLGLAGPKAKNVDISPSKQAWVDDVLEQARGSNGGVAVGDMGKVGGTKRVFLKGRSRAGSNA